MENLNSAYLLLDNLAQAIIRSAETLQNVQTDYFTSGDEFLSDYSKAYQELKKALTNFNKNYEDYMMEVEAQLREKWEERNTQIEQDYYAQKGESYE